MSGFSGQGKVYIGPRLVSGLPGVMLWVGNAARFEVALNTDTVERNESFSGQRLPNRRLTKGKGAKVTIVGDEWNRDNIARALLGTKVDVAAGSAVTNEVLPSGIVAGATVFVAGKNISAVTVKDSTGSPKTLPPGQYTIDAFSGGITLDDITTGGPYVQPFKADYTPGAVKAVGLFTAGQPEYYIRMVGMNTDDNNSAVVVDLYRVRIDPAKSLALITDDFADFESEGSVLVDTTRASNAALGQFGAITAASFT